MICKNCGNNFKGNFCNNCGQSAKVKRIDFKYLIQELPNSVFQLNHGFFYTTRELFLKPGHSIRAFLEGHRKRHYKPIAFLILTTALYALTTYLMSRNTILGDLISGFESGIKEEGDVPIRNFLKWLSKNQVYASLVIVPLYSTASFLAFIKSKYNYVEHLVLNFYITGQQMLIYLLLGFLFFKENVFVIVPFLVGMIYNFWAFHQFFKDKPFTAKLGLMMLTYIIFFLLFMFMVFVSGIFVGRMS